MAGAKKSVVDKSSIVTRKQAKSNVPSSSKQTPPTRPSSARSTPSTADGRINKLESELKLAVSKMMELESEMNLMKNQLIDQSRDVNSVLLNNSTFHNGPLDVQISERVDALSLKMETLESTMNKLVADFDKFAAALLKPNNEVDSLSRSPLFIDNTNAVPTTPTDDSTILPDPVGPGISGSSDVLPDNAMVAGSTPISADCVTVLPSPVGPGGCESSVGMTNSIPVAVSTSISASTASINSPRWKWFHLSSIVTLSPVMIMRYVSNKINNCQVRCYRLTPQNSRTFKVGVPYAVGNKLWASDFWPIGTIVRDFHIRKNFRKRRLIRSTT